MDTKFAGIININIMAQFDKEILQYIRVGKFIKDYTKLEYSSYMKHKLRGFDGNKKPIGLTDAESKEIEDGFRKLGSQLMGTSVQKNPEIVRKSVRKKNEKG